MLKQSHCSRFDLPESRVTLIVMLVDYLCYHFPFLTTDLLAKKKKAGNDFEGMFCDTLAVGFHFITQYMHGVTKTKVMLFSFIFLRIKMLHLMKSNQTVQVVSALWRL